MIDVRFLKETEGLVRGGRRVPLPAIQMCVGRAGDDKEIQRKERPQAIYAIYVLLKEVVLLKNTKKHHKRLHSDLRDMLLRN